MATPLQVMRHDGPVEPDSFIVRLKDDVSKATHLDDLRNTKPQIVSSITFEYDEAIFRGYSANLTPENLQFLLSHRDIEFISEDGICSAMVMPEDLEEVIEHEIVAAGEAASEDATQTVDVYGLDTGIYIEHSCFGGRASWGKNFTNDKDVDANGHGTHTAGTAVGLVYGEATSANVIAVKVLADNGRGRTSWIIAGIDWAYARFRTTGNRSVANMSLGGAVNKALDQAVRNAIIGGLSFSVSAGNKNEDAIYHSPARVKEANTVGAVDSNNRKAKFSNYGAPLKVWAPGVKILSAWIGNPKAAKRLSGTSMAAPRVAGYMAVALARENLMPPNLTDELIRHAIPVVTGVPEGTTNLLAQRW
ncbi:putative subtilisin-like serine protease [Mycena leptocephala]|nr:putative subtilisin-like serine protease [Mycena leptocephala]